MRRQRSALEEAVWSRVEVKPTLQLESGNCVRRRRVDDRRTGLFRCDTATLQAGTVRLDGVGDLPRLACRICGV